MTVALRNIARCVVEPATSVAPTVQLESVVGGSARLADSLPDLPPEGQNQFQPGDVLFSKLRPYLAKSLLVDRPLQGTGEFLCLRPSAELDPRYLKHVTLSQPWLEHAGMSSYGTKMPRTSWEHMATFRLPSMAVIEQRRIADFLDDRISRIDRLLVARREQSVLLREWFASQLELLLSCAPERVRSSRVMDVLPGYAFPSGAYSNRDSDVPLLRGVNVGVGSLNWDDTVRWPADDLAAVSQFRLSPGDVVMGMDRPWIGSGLRIAQLGCEDGNPLLLQRVAKLEPGPDLHPKFMLRAFQSQAFEVQVETDLTGLSVPHLSGEQILNYRLPFGPYQEQAEIASRIDDEDSKIDGLSQQLTASIDLFTEYKSALITAAVTGEVDVTTAGSNIPGVT